MQGQILFFVKNVNSLLWKGMSLVPCFLPSVILNFTRSHNVADIFRTILVTTSIFLSYTLYKSGEHSFRDSFRYHKELIQLKYWLLEQQAKAQTGGEVSHLNINILLSKLLRLQKMNASYCQVGFAHILIAICSFVDGICCYHTSLSQSLPKPLQTIMSFIYHIYPVLFAISLLLIIKSLEYLFVSEFNRMQHISTAVHIINKSIQDEIAIMNDAYTATPVNNNERRYVSIFQSYLDLQPLTELFGVYECCMIVCQECPDLMVLTSKATADTLLVPDPPLSTHAADTQEELSLSIKVSRHYLNYVYDYAYINLLINLLFIIIFIITDTTPYYYYYNLVD